MKSASSSCRPGSPRTCVAWAATAGDLRGGQKGLEQLSPEPGIPGGLANTRTCTGRCSSGSPISPRASGCKFWKSWPNGTRNAGPSDRPSAWPRPWLLEEESGGTSLLLPDLFAKCLSLWKELLNYHYYKKLAAGPLPPETPFRQRIWANLTLGQKLIDKLQAQHEQVADEVLRGNPFPLLSHKTSPSPTA